MHIDLQHGNILLEQIEAEDGGGEHYHAYILIKESMETVFQSISQLEEYPKFMPHVANVESVHYEQTTNFRYFIEVPMGINYQYEISTAKYESSEYSWLTWEIAPWKENNIVDTWGQWVITPYKNTDFTLVQYQVYTDIGYIPFGFGWIVDFLTEYSLPDVLLNTKEYVEAHD
ncbi:MAG: hypothetical protein H8E72_05315 [Candidatus Marinimicrobia bacterium]|nr:hypothetical protein [Candidatus Neomarinimicrobiota bacterium]